MRRAIAAGVMGGLVLGGTAVTPALAATPAATSGPAATAGPGLKTVVYAGYAFQVPATWPVYRLDEHPQTCVRYDVPAVYLGTPGASMDCPAGLVGRTQTVSFIPAGNGAPRAGGGSRQPARPARPQAAAGVELQRLPAVHSMISQRADQHELEVALGVTGAGGTVLGTYGAAPGVLEQVLNTLRPAPAGATPTAQSVPAQAVPARTVPARTVPAPTRAPTAHPAVVPQRAAVAAARTRVTRAPARHPAAAPKAYTSWQGVPSDWPTEIVQMSQPHSHPVGGFDACTAPSLATMRVWHSRYAAVGAYIGGINAACAYGNLSATWIKSVAAMGWGVLPTYVGPQAPCWNGGNGVLINPGKAAAQGNAAGLDAVSDAKYFGLPAGSPIYYDMEAYTGGTACKQAVLSFLGAWDRAVAACGYVTAVYSSRDSGIKNIQEWTTAHNPGFTPPDAIWIALWDGVPSLSGDPLAWPLTERSKQYSGSVNVTVGGITLNIDKDVVGGPVAR
jgi:Rv2525c-like, glycoside hydrolase-like domain